MVVLTGTTFVNATFDEIWKYIQDRGRYHVIYGVTAAGVCALSDLLRMCPCGRDE